MRADYEKPSIEFEEYELNSNIASGCTTIIDFGPEMPGHTTCKCYKDAFDVQADVWKEGSFYDGLCSCYLSAGGETLSTS